MREYETCKDTHTSQFQLLASHCELAFPVKFVSYALENPRALFYLGHSINRNDVRLKIECKATQWLFFRTEIPDKNREKGLINI